MELGKGSCSTLVLIEADCSMAAEHVKYILENEDFATLQVDFFFFPPLNPPSGKWIKPLQDITHNEWVNLLRKNNHLF